MTVTLYSPGRVPVREEFRSVLSRGFFDALVIWPTVAWPLIFSSIFFAIVRICQGSRQDGQTAALDAQRAPDALVLYAFFPVAGVFEVCVHAYLLWIIGWMYLPVAIPVYILGWILVPAILDGVPAMQFILPILYIVFAAAFLVLLGVVDLAPLKVLNLELYALFTGYPLPR